jgi:hypothetical protein
MIRRLGRRVVLCAPILEAEDDADHDNHHDQKGAIVLASATALIGITKLWQRIPTLSKAGVRAKPANF